MVNWVMTTLFILDLCSLIYSVQDNSNISTSFIGVALFCYTSLTYFRVLNVLEVHIVDRENLVSLLEPSSVSI